MINYVGRFEIVLKVGEGLGNIEYEKVCLKVWGWGMVGGVNPILSEYFNILNKTSSYGTYKRNTTLTDNVCNYV